jgi:hypothetical protein
MLCTPWATLPGKGFEIRGGEIYDLAEYDYEKKLKILHQMLIHSMKCKQTTDQNHVNTLRSLVKDFQTLYFEKK